MVFSDYRFEALGSFEEVSLLKILAGVRILVGEVHREASSSLV
jgi:hypothetical protein